jgi:hypothetical protein
MEQQLAQLLQSSFSADAATRKQAEAQLSALEKQQPNFGLLALSLATADSLDRSIRQGGLISSLCAPR